MTTTVAQPESRNAHEILAECLGELKHIRAALTSAADARSSVEIKTSTRGVDITSKAYSGSDIMDAESAAVQSYFRVLNEVQERLMGSAK